MLRSFNVTTLAVLSAATPAAEISAQEGSPEQLVDEIFADV